MQFKIKHKFYFTKNNSFQKKPHHFFKYDLIEMQAQIF